MQYKIINGAVSYDGNMVLENIDFEINDREKIAVIGRNGCGKTTLLKAIMGEVDLEEGTGESPLQVIRSGRPEIAYLRQIPFENESELMINEVKKVFAHLIEMEAKLQRLVDEMQVRSDEKIALEYSNLNDRFIALGGLTYKKEYQTMVRKFGFTEEEEKSPSASFLVVKEQKYPSSKCSCQSPTCCFLTSPPTTLTLKRLSGLRTI